MLHIIMDYIVTPLKASYDYLDLAELYKVTRIQKSLVTPEVKQKPMEIKPKCIKAIYQKKVKPKANGINSDDLWLLPAWLLDRSIKRNKNKLCNKKLDEISNYILVFSEQDIVRHILSFLDETSVMLMYGVSNDIAAILDKIPDTPIIKITIVRINDNSIATLKVPESSSISEIEF